MFWSKLLLHYYWLDRVVVECRLLAEIRTTSQSYNQDLECSICQQNYWIPSPFSAFAPIALVIASFSPLLFGNAIMVLNTSRSCGAFKLLRLAISLPNLASQYCNCTLISSQS